MTWAVWEPVWAEPTLLWLCLAGSHPQGACPGTETPSFFLLKRSPLSIKEKKERKKNRGKGYSEMRVFLPPPWSQTQVWTQRAGPPRQRGWTGTGQAAPARPAHLPLSLLLLLAAAACQQGALALSRLLSPSVAPLPLLLLTQWCFSFSSGKQVSIYFYFLLPRIRC